jgi:hypothetical protein
VDALLRFAIAKAFFAGAPRIKLGRRRDVPLATPYHTGTPSPKDCTLDGNETELAGLTLQRKKRRPNEVEASSADGSAIRGGRSHEQPDERDRQVRQPDSDGA